MTKEAKSLHDHTGRARKDLQRVRDHLREEVVMVDDLQLKAMLETSAEVLGGLIKAFSDFEQKNEPAWRQAR